MVSCDFNNSNLFIQENKNQISDFLSTQPCGKFTIERMTTSYIPTIICPRYDFLINNFD